MISIGNDIVDLTAIDKHRTRQKAFYSKITSDKEQQRYSRSSQIPFEIYVWLLWSAKESVYKFAKRLKPELVFSPARIEIILESEFSELTNFQNLTLDGVKFHEFLNSENFGSDHISEYNYQINYHFETYRLKSLISNNFIATIASNSSDFSNIQWGIKRIDQTDYKAQSVAVREFMLNKLTETFPNQATFSIDKSAVGCPVILNGGDDTNLKASFAHHGNYVSYAFGL